MSKVEKYELSQEAYDQRQGMRHIGMNGGLWGPKEVCAGGQRCPRADNTQGHKGEIGGMGSRGRKAGESAGRGVRLVWGQIGAWESSWSGRGMGCE